MPQRGVALSGVQLYHPRVAFIAYAEAKQDKTKNKTGASAADVCLRRQYDASVIVQSHADHV